MNGVDPAFIIGFRLCFECENPLIHLDRENILFLGASDPFHLQGFQPEAVDSLLLKLEVL